MGASYRGLIFMHKDKAQMWALRDLLWEHWMTKTAKLGTLPKQQKVTCTPLFTDSFQALSFSESEQFRHYAMSWKVRRQWLSPSLHSRPMLGTDKQNSQGWGLQTFLSISSLAFGGEAKQVVSSTNSRESVREGRVQRLAMLSLWLLEPQSLRRKFNSLSNIDDKLGSSLHFTAILLTNISWIRLFICASISEATKWQ